MTSRDFVYWLQGFLEISGASAINEPQTAIIRNHLNMVFIHEIDPSFGDNKIQDTLRKAHSGHPNSGEIYNC